MDVWSDASHFNLFHIIMIGFPEQGVREAAAWPPIPARLREEAPHAPIRD